MRPLLGSGQHAAALLGNGSEVLGLDDEVSADHDFGPRVQVFLPPGAPRPDLAALPATFEGFGTDQVELTTAGDFFTDRLGIDPADGLAPSSWDSASRVTDAHDRRALPAYGVVRRRKLQRNVGAPASSSASARRPADLRAASSSASVIVARLPVPLGLPRRLCAACNE
ncbi:hypothetical protein [Pseudosporangium ferrugineum]|uniref:hypothetical protein n=1 Tax=Pseudosporangium ferrugineum TaxID=439699 RepID=UPI0011B25F73|nr:hypothetical protein [Pseudosporangium ferrugineum]